MTTVLGSWQFQAPYAREGRARVAKALIDTNSRWGSTTVHRTHPHWTGQEMVTFRVQVPMDKVEEFEAIAEVKLKPLAEREYVGA